MRERPGHTAVRLPGAAGKTKNRRLQKLPLVFVGLSILGIFYFFLQSSLFFHSHVPVAIEPEYVDDVPPPLARGSPDFHRRRTSRGFVAKDEVDDNRQSPSLSAARDMVDRQSRRGKAAVDTNDAVGQEGDQQRRRRRAKAPPISLEEDDDASADEAQQNERRPHARERDDDRSRKQRPEDREGDATDGATSARRVRDVSTVSSVVGSNSAKKRAKYGYVLCISNEKYVDGSVVVAMSLADHSEALRNGTAELAILIPRTLSSLSVQRLRLAGYSDIRAVDMDVFGTFAPKSMWKDTLAKLLLWSLTDYERVVFFDADMLTISSPDHILVDYALPNSSYVGALGSGDGGYFQTGFMLLWPSAETFQGLITLMKEQARSTDRSAVHFRDGVVCRSYFGSRFVRLDNSFSRHTRPNVAGGETIFDPKYLQRGPPKIATASSPEDAALAHPPANRDDFLKKGKAARDGAVSATETFSVILYHYRGAFKPWMNKRRVAQHLEGRPDADPTELGRAYRLWWAYMEKYHRTAQRFLEAAVSFVAAHPPVAVADGDDDDAAADAKREKAEEARRAAAMVFIPSEFQQLDIDLAATEAANYGLRVNVQKPPTLSAAHYVVGEGIVDVHIERDYAGAPVEFGSEYAHIDSDVSLPEEILGRGRLPSAHHSAKQHHFQPRAREPLPLTTLTQVAMTIRSDAPYDGLGAFMPSPATHVWMMRASKFEYAQRFRSEEVAARKKVAGFGTQVAHGVARLGESCADFCRYVSGVTDDGVAEVTAHGLKEPKYVCSTAALAAVDCERMAQHADCIAETPLEVDPEISKAFMEGPGCPVALSNVTQPYIHFFTKDLYEDAHSDPQHRVSGKDRDSDSQRGRRTARTAGGEARTASTARRLAESPVGDGRPRGRCAVHSMDDFDNVPQCGASEPTVRRLCACVEKETMDTLNKVAGDALKAVTG